MSTVVFSEVFGIILNVPTRFRFMNWVPMPWSSRHWVTIKYIESEQAYYYFDSHRKTPERLGETAKLQEHVQKHLAKGESEMILVVEESKEDSQIYQTD